MGSFGIVKHIKNMIPKEILLESGALIKTFEKGGFIFTKGNTAKNFYQIVSGEVKMNNFNNDGREFIQGIFKRGDSFGEPPLLIDRVYPANAQVIKEAKILILPVAKFKKLLLNPEISLEISKTFAKRLHYKAIVAVEMSSERAEHRILSVLDYFKTYTRKNPSDKPYKIELTRQELANLTGLRVETAIRAIKSLEKKGAVKLINRKIYR